jgi:hypothetical protein
MTGSTPPGDPGPHVDGHDDGRVDLAGYVLGGLTLDEQYAVEAHVAVCPACRAELAELEPIPVLLDLATPPATSLTAADWTADPMAGPPTRPPTDPSIDPSPGPHRSDGRRSRRVLVSASAAVAVVAALIVGVMIGRPGEPSFSAPIALQAVSSAPTGGAESATATGTATLRSTAAGTVVRLDVSGLEANAGTWFECLWTSGQGAQSAGTFRTSSDGSASVELLTAARPYPGWSLEIVEHPDGRTEGRTVLRAQA